MSGTHNGQQMGMRVASAEIDAPDLDDQASMERALNRWLGGRGLKKSREQLRDESFARMRSRKLATAHDRREADPALKRPIKSTPKKRQLMTKEKLDAAQIGPRLKEARIAAGWDGRGVCALFRKTAPIDSALMYNAENGKTVSERTLERYCKTLNLRREWALHGDGEMWQDGGPTPPPALEGNAAIARVTKPRTPTPTKKPILAKPVALASANSPKDRNLADMLRAHRDQALAEIARLQEAVKATDALLATL